MPEIIEPRVLKGFRDMLPAAEAARASLIRRLEETFGSFGFVPIDTPVLEYAEILLGKGGGETDKQVYRFTDQGGRDVAMRFDLTVPFARFMAEHVDELYLPFRRYHVAKVWRGENTQRGRYREFMQCDFDIVGVDSASADADTVLLIAASMRALGVGEVRIRINHRGLFNRFLAAIGASDKAQAVLRAVDKLEKLGADQIAALLAAEIGPEASAKVMDFVRPEADFGSTLRKLKAACAPGDTEAEAAAGRLAEVYAVAEAAGCLDSLVLDPTITRGLDYYTGIVFETSLAAMPEIGSVCSGGRYNELASLYTTRRLPGVGAAIGLDRLLAAMEALGLRAGGQDDPKVLVVQRGDIPLPALQRAAAGLRALGVSAEVYPEPKKLAAQFAYAEKKGLSFALLLEPGRDGLFPLRVLASRQTRDFADLQSLAGFVLAESPAAAPSGAGATPARSAPGRSPSA